MLPPGTLARQSARQFADAFQIISGTLPDAEVHSAQGLRAAYAGTPSPFFNYFFLESACSPSELRAHLTQIRFLTEDREQRWVLVTPAHTFGAEHKDALEARAVNPLFDVTGMFSAKLPEPERDPPTNLEYSSRWGRKEISEFTALNMTANEMPVEEGEASVTSYFLLDPRCFPVLGSVSGQPVSAALAILLSDCIYLAWIAVDPAWQGQGYAEATIREAIRRAAAASGHESIALHASISESGLWRRLGLLAVASFEGYGHGI